MSEENSIQPANTDTTANPQPDACATGCRTKKSGLYRAVLYTPIALMLSTLAALATFPDLARYASPLIGESCSSQEYNCPIAAVANMMGYGKASQTAASGCCSGSGMSSFSCCPALTPCSSQSSESATSELPADSASAEEAPADAFSAANAVEVDSPSN